MAHPSRDNIERYRVFDKELKIQEYFSVSKLGKEKALKMALERQAQLDERKALRKSIRELSITRLFHDDGRVRGLRRIRREREGQMPYEALSFQRMLPPKRMVRKELSLSNRDFDDGWTLMIETILDFLEIESSAEIRLKFKEAKKYYWTPVSEQKELVNPHWELLK